MKTIVTILRGCATDAQMIASVIGNCVYYVFIAMLLASLYVVKWVENQSPEAAEKDFV